MKDIVYIDKNYDKQFYPRDLFEGLGLTDTKDLAEVAMFVLHGKDEETKTDIATCDEFIQFTTVDNKSGFSAIVVGIKNEESGLDMTSWFPVSQFWSKKEHRVIVTDIHLLPAGEVIVEGSLVDDEHPDGVTGIEFQDVKFYNRDKKYEIGKEYIFKFAGIAYEFIKRPEDERTFMVDEGPFAGKEINTTTMDGIAASQSCAGSICIMQPFTKFRRDSFIIPFSKKKTKIKIYDYRWVQGPVDLQFPINIGQNILGDYEPSPNEPINIGVIVQGFCV